jgi:predicted component of type VI protein secretion system
MRHATICGGTPYTITPLSPEARVLVNQGEIAAGAPFPLRSGDLITLGIYQLRFEADEEPAPRESDPSV